MLSLSRRQIISYAAIFIAVVLGIVILSQSTFRKHPLSSQPDGALLYNQAIQELTGNNEYSYCLQTKKKIVTPKNTYTESYTQNIDCVYSDNGDLQFSSSDTLSVGDYTINSTYHYENGTAYLNLDGSKFSAKFSQNQLQTQYAPAALLNPDNYKTIQAYSISTGTVIFFHSANSAEAWAKDSNMALEQAAGIALLDKKGSLTETVYCITYKLADTVIEKAVIAKPTEKYGTWEQILKEDYTPVNSLNAPLALELACGYLLQSNAISSQTTDSIICDAFGDRYIQNISLRYNTSEDFTASLSTSLLQQNSSRGGEVTESTQALIFSNGTCSVSTNNGTSVTDDSITQETMLQYCQDVLVGSILLPKDIRATKFTETAAQYRYDFTATQELATSISEKACLALYNDSTFLQKLASTYTSSSVNAYITLDKATLVPLASGISYEGTYIIDNFPYVLSYTAEQTYN